MAGILDSSAANRNAACSHPEVRIPSRPGAARLKPSRI